MLEELQKRREKATEAGDLEAAGRFNQKISNYFFDNSEWKRRNARFERQLREDLCENE